MPIPVNTIFQGRWKILDLKTPHNSTLFPLKNNEGMIYLRQKEDPSKKSLVIDLFDGDFYENPVIQMELSQLKQRTGNNSQPFLLIPMIEIRSFPDFYSSIWLSDKLYNDIDVDIPTFHYLQDSNSQVEFELFVNSTNSENYLKIYALLEEDTSYSIKYGLYFILVVAITLSKMYAGYQLFNEFRGVTVTTKFSFFTLMGAFIWDFLVFKGYIIPIHNCLPLLIKASCTLIIFFLGIFEISLFSIINFNSLLSDDESATFTQFALRFGSVFMILLGATVHSEHCCIVFSLYLLPQIWKNYKEGVVSEKIEVLIVHNLSILLFFYFKCVPSTIGNIQKDIALGALVLALLGLQIYVIYMQSKFHPRFFSSKAFDDLNTYYTFQDTSDPSKKFSEDVCSICLRDLSEVPLSPTHQIKNKLGFLWKMKNKEVVITACKHRFHTPCLSEWVESKPQCPLCRNTLDRLV